MIIEYTKGDLKNLNFTYLVQINNDDHQDNIFSAKNKSSEGFWIEKRMKLIIRNEENNCSVHGFYYGNITNLSDLELLEHLNHSKSRSYRRLNKVELAFFTEWLNSRHY